MGEAENVKLYGMKEENPTVQANVYAILLILETRLRDIRKLPQVPSWREAELGRFPRR